MSAKAICRTLMKLTPVLYKMALKYILSPKSDTTCKSNQLIFVCDVIYVNYDGAYRVYQGVMINIVNSKI